MSRISPEGSDRVLRSRSIRVQPANSNAPCTKITEDYSDEISEESGEEHSPILDDATRKINHGFGQTPPNATGAWKINHGFGQTPPNATELMWKNKNLKVVATCTVAVLACVAIVCSIPTEKKSNFEGFELFQMLIFKERRSFNQKEGTFEILAEGVAPPTCITLLYLDGKDEAECISSRIKNLYETTFSTDPIVLRGSEIYEAERFDFLESYGRKLNDSKLMVLYDLDQINAAVAENFHSLCDVENPFVRDSTIIFTLNMDAEHKSLKNPLKKAHRTLSEKWKELEMSALDPLITRVTNVVVEINKENDFTCPK